MFTGQSDENKMKKIQTTFPINTTEKSVNNTTQFTTENINNTISIPTAKNVKDFLKIIYYLFIFCSCHFVFYKII